MILCLWTIHEYRHCLPLWNMDLNGYIGNRANLGICCCKNGANFEIRSVREWSNRQSILSMESGICWNKNKSELYSHLLIQALGIVKLVLWEKKDNLETASVLNLVNLQIDCHFGYPWSRGRCEQAAKQDNIGMWNPEIAQNLA